MRVGRGRARVSKEILSEHELVISLIDLRHMFICYMLASRSTGSDLKLQAQPRNATMVRRVGGGEYRATCGSPSSAVSVREKRRVDRLAETIDQCSAAKDAADVLGEKFLAYLLAMAIEEARAAMRSDLTKEPRFMPAREGRAKS